MNSPLIIVSHNLARRAYFCFVLIIIYSIWFHVGSEASAQKRQLPHSEITNVIVTDAHQSNSVTIKLVIEGFYDTTSNRLNIIDTVNAYLINMFQPEVMDSASAVIDSLTFEGNFVFNNVPTGKYFIAITHRNSIETWSRAEGEIIINGEAISYDFTNDSSRAYGSNLKLKGSKWCIYSGDVNQDGIVDLSDVSLTDVDNLNFMSGYTSTDINGDGIVDLTDISLVDNNNLIFVSKEKPELPGGTCPGIPTVEYGGKTYHTIQIGDQCWLKENLNIGVLINDSQNQADNIIIEKYCYNNDTNYCNTYGGLYQWNEAMQYVTTAGTKGICPNGWHIPTLSEVETLANVVNNNSNELKAIGQGTGGGTGINTSGFSALMAGYRWKFGGFNNINNTAYIWTSTEQSEEYSYELYLFYMSGPFFTDNYWYKECGFSVRCLKNSPPEIPTLSSPSNGAAEVGMPPTLIWNASQGAEHYRVAISTDSLFTSVVYDSSSITDTSNQVIGLSYLTTYYWRVNTTNSYGTSSWSNTWSFTTESSCPPRITYLGKTYNTVLIGAQCWLKENLDVGTRINGSQNQTNNSTIEKYCYGDDNNNCTTYGGLYQWDEVMLYIIIEGSQGICPNGWHVPTLAEFQTLSNSVGGSSNSLKAIGQGSGAGAGTNTSGFSALLGGYRDIDGLFGWMGNGHFWSSTEISQTYAKSLILLGWGGGNDVINFWEFDKPNGFSVRCLNDIQRSLPPDIPTLSNPGNNAINIEIPVSLSWNSSVGATRYTLQVSTDDQFTAFVFNQSNLISTSKILYGMIYSTTYYWRVSAQNEFGSSGWSTVRSFTTEQNPSPCPEIPSVLYAGKYYNTVMIASQCWLKENLDVGLRIDGNQDQTNNGTIEKYCYANNDENCKRYGGLYSWAEAMQYANVQGSKGICPAGWHVPTSAEFQTLSNSVGGSSNALKEVGEGSGAGAGTNTSAFSALLAGYADENFYALGVYGYFWSSTPSMFAMLLRYNTGYIDLYEHWEGYGYSLRCIKNVLPEIPVLSNPTNGKIDVNLPATLSWNSSIGAQWYRIQVSTEDQFLTTVYDENNIINTSKAISGLLNSTKYYWRVSAMNESYTSDWSSTWSFYTIPLSCPDAPSVSYDGKTYNTVLIGSQCWLRQNLDIGTRIFSGLSQANNGTIEKYCYDNLDANCVTYGGLYQWNEAMQYTTTSGTQGICPPGWHIPSLADYQTLNDFVAGSSNALKAIGQGSGSGAGTNTSGFSALMAGYCWGSVSYALNVRTKILSSSIYSSTGVFDLNLYYSNGNILLDHDAYDVAYSIRCIKGQGALTPPTLISPNNGATNLVIPLTLTWNPSVGATSYRLQVSTSDQFTTTVYDQNNITSTNQVVSGLTFLTTYYWRVNAKDSYGTSDWSAVWSFTTGSLPTPLLSAPINESINIVVPSILIWNTSIGATSYRLQVSTSNQFSTTVYDSSNITDTSKQIIGLSNLTTYYWRVNAANSFGASNWSSIWSFTTTGPLPFVPILASPNNGVTNITVTPTLSWNSSTGADNYRLQVSTSNQFTTTVFDQSNITNTTKEITGLNFLTKYYWRVNATNSYGTSDWSSIWSFTTRDLLPNVPVLFSPSNGATNVVIPTTLNWNASVGATSYRLQVSTSDQFTTTLYDSINIVDTSQQVIGLSNSTAYYWRVNATNSYGTSDWSSIGSFVTDYPHCIGVPTVSYSGKTYNTVLIGAQCWLRENLDVGTRINGNQNQANNSIIEKYCYNNDTNYCNTYGGLYQWDEAMQYVTTEGAQGICPTGWHVPTLTEFDTLSSSVGGNSNALKAIGQGIGSGAGTNTSGFSALLAGIRYDDGYFYELPSKTYFWSSTEYGATYPYSMDLWWAGSLITFNSGNEYYGYSVRCLKD